MHFRKEDIRRSIESLDCVLAEYEEVPFHVMPSVPFTPEECDEYADVSVIARPGRMHHGGTPQNEVIYDDNVLCARNGLAARGHDSNETSLYTDPKNDNTFDGIAYLGFISFHNVRSLYTK